MLLVSCHGATMFGVFFIRLNSLLIIFKLYFLFSLLLIAFLLFCYYRSSVAELIFYLTIMSIELHHCRPAVCLSRHLWLLSSLSRSSCDRPVHLAVTAPPLACKQHVIAPAITICPLVRRQKASAASLRETGQPSVFQSRDHACATPVLCDCAVTVIASLHPPARPSVRYCQR